MFNLPHSTVAPPPEQIALCGNRESIQGTVDGPGTEAYGWEGVADALNSLELGNPGVLVPRGGANPTGGFIGACDFNGSDFTQIYCLDAGAGAGTLFTVSTGGPAGDGDRDPHRGALRQRDLHQPRLQPGRRHDVRAEHQHHRRFGLRDRRRHAFRHPPRLDRLL